LVEPNFSKHVQYFSGLRWHIHYGVEVNLHIEGQSPGPAASAALRAGALVARKAAEI
jgi:hypothetical protein